MDRLRLEHRQVWIYHAAISLGLGSASAREQIKRLDHGIGYPRGFQRQ